MKLLIKLIVVLILIVIVVPIVLAKYFLFSNPRDLGVTYTPADYTSTHQKISTEVGTLPASTSLADSLQFSGKKDINITLNSSEVTAYLNADNYIYTPFSQVQVKINPDGTAQASGILNVQNFIKYVSLTTPTAEVQQAIDKFKIPANPSFYAQGTVTVTNNQVNFNVQQLEVGRISVPQNYVTQNTGALNSYASKRLNSIPNLQVRSLTLTGGQTHIDATVPEKVLKVVK